MKSFLSIIVSSKGVLFFTIDTTLKYISYDYSIIAISNDNELLKILGNKDLIYKLNQTQYSIEVEGKVNLLYPI